MTVFVGYERQCSAMGFTKDPMTIVGDDPEAMRERDAEVARLRRSEVPFLTRCCGHDYGLRP